MIKLLIAALLAFVAATAEADMPFHETDTTKIWLTDKPCADQGRVQFFAQYTTDKPLTAVVVFKGRQLSACYVVLKSDNDELIVFLNDDDGDVGGIPLKKFHTAYGA